MGKRVFKMIAGFERTKEKKFLEKMFKNGYRFSRHKWYAYYFEQVEPQDVIYDFDYQILKNTEEKEYLSYISDWTFTARVGAYYWFYKILENDDDNYCFFNNNESKMNFYKKQLNFFLIFSIFLLISSVSLFINPQKYMNLFALLNLGLSLLYLKYFIKYYLRYKKAKNDILE